MRAGPFACLAGIRLAQDYANRRQYRDVQDGIELAGNVL